MTDRPPTRRSDATRNRERILATARAAFADPGAEVSMAEIARRSGVGPATLYRNFATRRELLEALYVDEVDAVCAAAATVEEDGAGNRLAAWLRRFADYATSKRHVAVDLLAHTDRSDSVFVASRERVLAAGAPLLAAAQEAGEVSPALTLDQVLDLIVAIAKIPGDAAHREPILDVALAGLRRSATS